MPELDEEERERLERIEEQVRAILNIFNEHDTSVAEGVGILLSVVTTGVYANNMTHEGIMMIAEEFEKYVTFLRTGVMPQGNRVYITDADGKPIVGN